MIEAASVRPDFAGRQSIPADELRHVEEPCAVFEADWLDSDGERVYAYTLGGWLRGQPLGGLSGGVLVGGDAMLVHAASRAIADTLASLGLEDTIAALQAEERDYQEAQAALARLSKVGPVRRLELATAPAADLSDAFVEDSEAIRKLRGDDIVLAGGGVH
jgi:hypothetical protein